MTNYIDHIHDRFTGIQSCLCVGLDTVIEQIPAHIRDMEQAQLRFNQMIIDATHDLVCCYKPNLAFYSYQGTQGMEALRLTIEYCHSRQVPVILDAKYGDIGHTAEYYAKTAFDYLKADGITLAPYMGRESIVPFSQYEDKFCYILCYTSNLSRIDLQKQSVVSDNQHKPFYHLVAEKILEWNEASNLGAVVGATAPEEMAELRNIMGPDLPILCPGVGTQGGDLEEILWAGQAHLGNLIINVSRSIIFSSNQADFQEAARREAEMYVAQMRNCFEQTSEG